MIGRILSVARRQLAKVKYQFNGAITNVKTQEKAVALTFDDGPHPVYTPALLDVLGKYGAKATFFAVGEQVERNPSVIRRMAESGHCIGNHSWDHPSFPVLSHRARRDQIRKCHRALAAFDSNLLRPPFGHQNMWSRVDALISGYDVIGWNNHGEDWLDHPADVIFEKIQSRLTPGSIVLLHDNLIFAEDVGYLDRTAVIEAVEMLLRENPDYRFVTVPDLLKLGTVNYRKWTMEGPPGWLASLQRTPQVTG